MHPYKTQPIDLKLLSNQYPSLLPYITVPHNPSGPYGYDWTNTHALHELTRILLLHYNHIQYWSMSMDNLCPALTQRINYLCWIHYDLLCHNTSNTNTIHGIDIGCGASLIFALLAYTMYQHHMVCTDIDAKSIENCNTLIHNNNLSQYIHTIHNKQSTVLLTGLISHDRQYCYTICNPPFFDSIDLTQQHNKRSNNATHTELVCGGGERTFIQQHITESLLYKHTIGWFTTMCGMKSTYKYILKQLRLIDDIVCVRHTCMKQGKQSRWAIAWTYQQSRIAQLIQHNNKHMHVKTTTLRSQFTVPFNDGANVPAEYIQQLIRHMNANTTQYQQIHCIKCNGTIFDYTAQIQATKIDEQIQINLNVSISVFNKQLVVVMSRQSTEDVILFQHIVQYIQQSLGTT